MTSQNISQGCVKKCKSFAISIGISQSAIRASSSATSKMPHVHVFLVVPLCTEHVKQSSADQHQCGIPIRQGAHVPDTAPNFPGQTLNHVVGNVYASCSSMGNIGCQFYSKPVSIFLVASNRFNSLSSAITGFAFPWLLSCFPRRGSP